MDVSEGCYVSTMVAGRNQGFLTEKLAGLDVSGALCMGCRWLNGFHLPQLLRLVASASLIGLVAAELLHCLTAQHVEDLFCLALGPSRG